MKKVAVFDLDGTLDKGDCFKSFIFIIFLKSPQKWIFFPNLILSLILFYINPKYTRSKLKSYFLKIIIKGQKQKFLDKEAELFINHRVKYSINNQVLEYVNLYNNQNIYTILATGSLNIYALKLARLLKIDFVISSRLYSNNKIYDGSLENGNCIGINKFNEIEIFLKDNNILWKNVIFFSDHHSDLPIFKKADENYAVRPTFLLKEQLKKQNINHKVIF